MNKELKKLEKLLKESKVVDSKTFEVDQKFKESLREKLYSDYLENHSKEGFIMSKLRALNFNWKLAFLGVGILFFVSLFVGGGIYLFTRRSQTTQEAEVLLAANLAITDGSVEVKRDGEDSWNGAVQGDVLEQGDSIKTQEGSKAVLELDNGNAVRLNSNSEIRLESMNPTAVVVEQLDGESYNRVASSQESTHTVKGQGVEASALGTGYTFSNNEEDKQVVVAVYDNKVKLNVEEKEVEELEKAIVDVEKNKVEVKDMTEEEFTNEFAMWNKEQDKEIGVTCHEENGPTVTITSPSDGTETEAQTVAVTGTVTDAESPLRKIIVNGQIYTSKDENGKGFDLNDGTFDVDVSLQEGENVITVKAYDIYWNSSEEVSVKVVRKSNESQSTNYFYVSNVSSPEAGKIYVKWVMTGYSASYGFKLVAAQGSMPVYPGSEFTYISDGNSREGYITGLSEGTYNVRVCIYNGSGACIMYTTNYKSIYVSGDVKSEEEQAYPTAINITGISKPEEYCCGKYKVVVSWSPVGAEAPNGYKVCWADHANPTYPDDLPNCQYMSSGSRSYIVTELEAGKTYYFRVGAFRDGYCDPYSENKSVTI